MKTDRAPSTTDHRPPQTSATRSGFWVALRDGKGSAVIEEVAPDAMVFYGRICGQSLARAHARSGDRVAIVAYLRARDRFDNAIADIAEAYADQNELDHAALAAAIEDGQIDAPIDL